FRKTKIYTSIGRARALQQCGWSSRFRQIKDIDSDLAAMELNSTGGSSSALFDDSMPCAQFVKSNQAECNYTRSAAAMVFNGKIRDAIDCLNRASKQDDSVSLSAIALALSGLATSTNQL